MSCELQGEGTRSILPTKLVATATSLEGSKKITSARSPTAKVHHPANFVKIGPVDVAVIGLTEITKDVKNKTSAKYKPSPPAQSDWDCNFDSFKTKLACGDRLATSSSTSTDMQLNMDASCRTSVTWTAALCRQCPKI